MLEVLRATPLAYGHDGRNNMSEQGIVACAFDALGAVPIPLSEFPFGRAFEEQLNYGLAGPKPNSWGSLLAMRFVVKIRNSEVCQLKVKFFG